MKEIPFSARWTIAEDDLIRIKDSGKYEKLQSKFISTSFGVKYCFLLYPNGHNAEYRRKVMICLKIDIENLRKVRAMYTVRTESANFSHKRSAVFEKSIDWGNSYRDTAEFFDAKRKFIVDGKLILTLDGIFEVESDEFYRYSFGLIMGNQLWTRDDTKDFLIIGSDGKGIKAHKIVLQARSPVFEAMFRSGMKEVAENQVEIIDFSSDVIERALFCMYDYGGGFQCSPEQILSLMQFFDKYDIKTRKDQFEELLLDSVCPMYACKLMNCAIKSNALKLKEKCFECLTAALVEKTPIADLDILDKEVLLKIVRHSLYQNVETDE